MCLLLTDLHLGLRNEDPNFLELSKILHEEILTYCFYNDIETIYNLGDFFHNRNSIGLKTMQTAKEIADMIEE
jgi:DNA repair exonuclease SbcCD nuclease subunit